MEHFQESLDINSLQKDLWYKYGYAALMEEKWETSAMAYRRYVVLDNEVKIIFIFSIVQDSTLFLVVAYLIRTL